MAVVVISNADVRPTNYYDGDSLTLPAATPITMGQLIYPDTNGKWALVDADTAATLAHVFIALDNATKINMPVLGIERGYVFVGSGLDALAYGALLYASNTTGAIDTAAGTTSKVVGWVAPLWGENPPAKLIRFMAG